MPDPPPKNGLLANWRCLLACTLVSMSPFQYGIDFGAIGGLQAMSGFLEVPLHPHPPVSPSAPLPSTPKFTRSARFSATPTPPSPAATTSRRADNNSSPR